MTRRRKGYWIMDADTEGSKKVWVSTEQDGECQRCGGRGCEACDARFLNEPPGWGADRVCPETCG